MAKDLAAKSESRQLIVKGAQVKAIMPGCQSTTIVGKVKSVGEVSSLISDEKGTSYLVLNREIVEVFSDVL